MAKKTEPKKKQGKETPRQGEIVALTGASNYLGQGLIRRLLANPAVERIIALDVHPPKLQDRRVTFHKVDLTSPSSLEVASHIFSSENVTMFVHLVFTYTLSRNRTLAHELEAIGTMHALDACSVAKVKRIVARSTTAIYGANPNNPNYLTEQHRIDQQRRDSITADKVELERQMQQYAQHHPDCKVAILRDCTSLGATSINYLSSILLARHSPRLLGYDPLMQFIHEEDLFRAYEQVVLASAEGVFNIVGKGVVRYSDAIRLAGGSELVLPESLLSVGVAALWNTGVYDIPANFLRHLKFPWVADGSKAAIELGFAPEFDCFQALEETRRRRAERED